MLVKRGAIMAKINKSEGKVVKETSIVLGVKELTKDDKTIVVIQAQEKGKDGRVKVMTFSGTGKDTQDAIDDLHANVARKPVILAAMVREALAGIGTKRTTIDPELAKKFAVASKKASRMKELKAIITANKLDIKIPSGCSTEKLEQLVKEAMVPSQESQDFDA